MKKYQKKNIMISFEQHVQRVEKHMGISVEEFHRRLDSLLTPEYLAEAAENKRFVEEWLRDGKPICRLKKKHNAELVLQPDEYFTQCFAPDKPVRNELPTYWFYSNYDNVISIHQMYGKRKVIWLPPKFDPKDMRGFQKWMHPITGHIKSIKQYTLGSIVLKNGNLFGRASAMLEMFGSYAYGACNDQYNLNSHHEQGVTHHREKIHDHNDIATVDIYAHNTLRNIRTVYKQIRMTDDKAKKNRLKDKLLNDVAKFTKAEAPDQGVLIWTGNSFDLDGNYRDDKDSYAYQYLADVVADKEWYISVCFLPGTGTAEQEWVLQTVSADQQRLLTQVSHVLRQQDMPYGTFTVLPYPMDDAAICNLVIVRMKPAEVC